jgi:hypothetical protein
VPVIDLPMFLFAPSTPQPLPPEQTVEVLAGLHQTPYSIAKLVVDQEITEPPSITTIWSVVKPDCIRQRYDSAISSALQTRPAGKVLACWEPSQTRGLELEIQPLPRLPRRRSAMVTAGDVSCRSADRTLSKSEYGTGMRRSLQENCDAS